ncbi:hypothetical protein OSB04_012409 [Centaurea solstitialis]|uniref:Uncharacterized protein n=1 Tax=Centaurea solstitialis TaxID=347529 RepID=A0AA38WME6_9ASTR|nr:hypothetical protein OSB04_012409 [Centaurea solstitialis]
MSSFTLTNNKQKMAAQNSDFSDSSSSETETLLSFHDQGGGNDEKVIQHNVFSDLKLKKVNLGIQETNLFLPFQIGSRKLAECRVCENAIINPWEKVSCSIHDCRVSYHLKCAKERVGLLSSSKHFKCPQHACYLCKKKAHLWRCSKCDLAAHRKCAAYPGYMKGKPSAIICWRHSTDWPPSKSEVPTSSIEEVFGRLPLPYAEEEFKIDPIWKCTLENNLEPSPYEHIKRNIYRIKKKGDNVDDSIGCARCDSGICIEDCECRLQCISCSSACGCSEMCTNRPFKENKRIKIVMTHRCGWGLEADEFIEKGEFIIEYVGEVISEALCQKRFWGMKEGATNFYMCEVRKGFIIDATFKGNESRFLNHSCDPNCNLEKWEVDGETRLGVFAKRSIKRGEPLTYHYRFVRFGPEIECYCGSSNCQGYLGTKKKKWVLSNWGAKRRRINF